MYFGPLQFSASETIRDILTLVPWLRGGQCSDLIVIRFLSLCKNYSSSLLDELELSCLERKLNI